MAYTQCGCIESPAEPVPMDFQSFEGFVAAYKDWAESWHQVSVAHEGQCKLLADFPEQDGEGDDAVPA